MRARHRWEEMLPEELNAELARAPVAYFACGAMEDHGLQNALGTDPYVAYEMCLRAAEISGGVVLPPVPLAPAGIPGYSREELRSGERELYPPSLWVSRELCQRVYTELLESMADLGFRACVTNGGHWPADALLQEIEREHGGLIRGMRFWGGGVVRLLEAEIGELSREDPLALGHAAMWETSMVMATRRDWVDLSRVPFIKDSPIPQQLQKASPEVIAHTAQANVELGERMLNRAAERMAGIAQELLS